jgi:hypothetical protein
VNERPDEHYTDAELISIIEGPPPQFRQPLETWAFSIHEDVHLVPAAYCQMRTLNGPHMLERCQNAWLQDRPVQLDFPDTMGLRQRADIVAARWSETEEGHLLHLWVRMPDLPGAEDDPDLSGD